jgi:hypothetical protein
MSDGSLVVGAQGNRPVDRIIGTGMRVAWEKGTAKERDQTLSAMRAMWKQELWTPWIGQGAQSQILQLPLLQMAAMHEAIPPGVLARQRSSVLFPPAIPDLIGIKDIRYLDRTGLMQHREIADLMRYAALNQGADMLASYGGFIPLGKDFLELPDPATQERYSDEQLYALALYIYSLKPPQNPNRFDSNAARGQDVFRRQGCANCHPPPLYTNNKLLPVDEFHARDEQKERFDVLGVPIGTDPRLTMETRRGTGFYKVPSLRGVWYRGPFEHNGSVATLEDWFDPHRLSDRYVPTGFKGYGVSSRAIKGHEFGLKLSTSEKSALIAFLKTL